MNLSWASVQPPLSGDDVNVLTIKYPTKYYHLLKCSIQMNEEIINIHLDQVYFQFMISGHICFFPLFVLSYTWIEYFINYSCSVLSILNRDSRFSGWLVNGYCYLSWICYAINCKKRGRQRSKLSSLMVHVNGKDRRLKII